MKEPLHIRVFELQGDKYQLCKSFKKYLEAGGMMSNLADAPVEEV